MPASQRGSQGSDLKPILVFGGTVATLYLAREVLIPFAIALTLTFLLAPIVRGLQNLRMPRIPAVLFVLSVCSAIALGLGWIIAGQVITLGNDLPLYRENIDAKIAYLRKPAKSSLQQAVDNVKEIGKEITGANKVEAPAPPPGRDSARQRQGNIIPSSVQVIQPKNDLEDVAAVLRPAVHPVTTIGLVLIFSIFMLIEKEQLRNRLLRLSGVSRLGTMTVALDDAAKRISRYLLLQSLVNLAFGALCATGLFYLGVPHAALWGVLAATLRFVPYVGTIMAAAIPLLLAIVISQTWLTPLLVFLLFAALELITGNAVEPWLYGTHTGLSPLAILVATVFWTILWGFPGLLLSTPLTVCAVVFGRYIPHLSFLSILFGDEPVLEPAAVIYQRLLAMDQQEAHEAAEQYLKDHSLIELYDLVLIPALTMMEQDRHKGCLDQVREEFLFLNLRELIVEFSDGHRQPPAATSDAPDEWGRIEPVFTGRLISVAASDNADVLAALMLSQLVEIQGSTAEVLPSGATAKELDALVAGDKICISAVPPFALARCKALLKEIRIHFPRIQVIVGIWSQAGEVKKLSARIGVEESQIVRTLSEAIGQICEVPSEADDQVNEHVLVSNDVDAEG